MPLGKHGCTKSLPFLSPKKKKESLPFKGISVVLWHTSCEDNEHHTLKIYNNKIKIQCLE